MLRIQDNQSPSLLVDSPARPYLGEPRTVGVLGAPLALGQPLAGVDLAPSAMRLAGLQGVVESLGWGFQDFGDVIVSQEKLREADDNVVGPRVKNGPALGEACRLIADKTEKIAARNHLALTIGGDHSIALGSISGVARCWKNLGVIWVDAHGDFNTPETSPSGNLHGMPLSGLVGAFELAAQRGFSWFHPCLDPRKVVLVGVRSLDPGEKYLLQRFGVRVFTMTEVDRFGIGKVMELALQAIDPEGVSPLHLSLDIDALDPSVAPGTGTRVRGGLNYREAHYIAEAIAETQRLVAMDLVEVNPSLGREAARQASLPTEPERDPTVEMGLELVESALGKRILDTTPLYLETGTALI